MLARPAAPSPTLPPAFRLIELDPPVRAQAEACRTAASAGAGALFWARRSDVLEFAVVLEPEEPLGPARRAFYLGLSALADAVGSCAPPEKPISFEWPDTICFDGARLGGAQLAWPEKCGEEDTPAWLVFSAMLIASKAEAGEPGLTPGSTSLEEEACEWESAGPIIESFARYLMWGFDLWAAEGFEHVGARYLARVAWPDGSPPPRFGPNGDLLVGTDPDAERFTLACTLRSPTWLDPATGSPRL